MKRKPTIVLLLLISSLFFKNIVVAQALYPVSIDEKIQQSSLIVEGQVVEQTPFWNAAHTMIFTSNKVKTYKVFKGAVVINYIDVMTQGGTIDNIVMGATELLELEKGHVGIFFCYPNTIHLLSPVSGKLLFDVYSSSQGFFNYDLQKQSANAPFVRYTDIENQVYPELQQKTGRAFENLDPSFKVSSFAPVINGVLAPGITGFSPTTVNAGALSDAGTNLLTINGSAFGTATGSAGISFDDANDGTGGAAWFVPANSSLIVSWSATQIQVRVPSRAGTGTFTVTDNLGAASAASSTLNIKYSILNLTFGAAPEERMFNLMNNNGSGGYSFVYSTSTAGSGVDFSTSAQKAPFERAIATWKEVCGLNYINAATTTSQSIAAATAPNIIMLDNTNTGVPVLPSGVLASCYYSGGSCTGNLNSQSPGFDILIRNSGVSTGAVNFNNGPCKTSIAIAEFDMESVLLHELGHSLGLGHINDSYIGGWPNVDPGKLMNYSIVNGVDRRSPDWSCYTGALYCINPRGLNYGGCGATEMIPLVATPESKDNCPLTFPSVATPTGTSVLFDLNHATSDKTIDPQYTGINCTATGTGITNNAYYAIKTGAAGGSTVVTVSGYTTTPSTQAACGAGVELALYQVSTCPTAQTFPAPVACRTFNANGALATFTGLAANTNYLLMVDGISNTRANFTLTLTGAALPAKIIQFSGTANNTKNYLQWKIENLFAADKVILESSIDGIVFNETATQYINSTNIILDGNYNDYFIAPVKYYRLKIVTLSGTVEYSNIIVIKQNSKGTDIVISPNPVKNKMTVSFFKNVKGNTTFKLLDVSGKQIMAESFLLTAGQQSHQINLADGLAAGVYVVEIWNDGICSSHKIIIN
ncbi:MAG: T9SS type A sorting domain-containing protein [Ferruginibacter sp.]